jgi:hypothetical protein
MEVITDKPDFDEVIREAKRAAGSGEPIKVRIQPSTYNKERTTEVMWPGVIWKVLCANIEEVRDLRKALDEFFSAMARGGVHTVIAVLRSVQAS